MPYRGPNKRRIASQFSGIHTLNGEACTWRRWASASTAAGSALYAGGGIAQHYIEQTITALWNPSRFWQTQLPGGQEIAGDAMVSTLFPLGSRDQLDWRGTTYRIDGDSVPVHLGGRLWYNTILRRGDVTG